MAQKYSREMGNFWSMCPEASIKGDFEISWFQDLCFWSLKRFGRFEAVVSFNAYQIANYQFPSKTHHFLLLDFRRIREEVSKSVILWPIAWVGVIKKFIWFFKIVPFEAPRSLIQMVSKRNGVFIEVGLLSTLITNSFENLFKNLETFLFIIFLH